MLRISAIFGSPRRGGNTDILLEKALEAAKSKSVLIKRIILNDLNLRPCQECGGCLKTGICVISDDMAIVYKALDESDIVIVASPIFFGNISAQTKIMVDRMQCFWVRKYLLKKKTTKENRKGAFISCSGLKKEGYFQCAKRVIEVFFKVQDIDYKEELFVGGIDKAGEVLKHNDVLQKAYELGGRLIANV